MRSKTLLFVALCSLTACSSSELGSEGQANAAPAAALGATPTGGVPTGEMGAVAEASRGPGAAAENAAADGLVRSALKAKIRTIAAANTTRTDNVREVELLLRPLVAALGVLNPARTPEQAFDALEGSWKNVWSNVSLGDLPLDAAHVYQVFTKRGHYYNLLNVTLSGQTATYVMRASYAGIPEGFAIRFTDLGYTAGSLAGLDGNALVQLEGALESGSKVVVSPPSLERLAGLPGKLTTIYVDGDFRIAGGEVAPVFDDQGKVLAPGQYNMLFVLERP